MCSALARRPEPQAPNEVLFDLDSASARSRISPAAFRAFDATADYLSLTVPQRCRLLGEIPSSTYHRWAKAGASPLSRDQLERISLLLGIVKGIRLLFANDDAGRRWLTAANQDVPFAGAPPLERMLRGSISDLYTVRRYIDAWRGVWP